MRITKMSCLLWLGLLPAAASAQAPRDNSPNDPPIMIDALGANQVESVLLPGLAALGLDPAQVKAILVGHGHADHFGGSAYMQERFGTKVYISAGGGGRGPQPPLPRRDPIMTEGKPLVFGNLTVTPIAIPGHTPGAIGFIFPVTDNGTRHTVALFGGTVLTPSIISDDGLKTHRASAERVKTARQPRA